MVASYEPPTITIFNFSHKLRTTRYVFIFGKPLAAISVRMKAKSATVRLKNMDSVIFNPFWSKFDSFPLKQCV